MSKPTSSIHRNALAKTKSPIKLISFDRIEKEIAYFDECEVRLTRNVLRVKPTDKNATDTEIAINKNFVKFKNLIYFDDGGLAKFALIFENQKASRHVFRVIDKRKKPIGKRYNVTPKTFEKEFIVPLIHELRNYLKLDVEFRIFILKLLKSLSIDIKQRIFKPIHATKMDQSLIDFVLEGVVEAGTPSKVKDTKKRRQSTEPMLMAQLDNSDDDIVVQSSPAEASQHIENLPPKKRTRMNSWSPEMEKPIPSAFTNDSSSSYSTEKPSNTLNFKVIDYKQNGIYRSHLFIFSTDDETMCNEYYLLVKSKKYMCCDCNKSGIAYDKDKDAIQFLNKRCACTPRTYEPEKYLSDIIIRQTDYKVIKRRSSSTDAEVIQNIFVFSSVENQMGYLFTLTIISKKSQYRCVRCRSLNQTLRAIIDTDENGDEYVAYQNKNHACQPVKWTGST